MLPSDELVSLAPLLFILPLLSLLLLPLELGPKTDFTEIEVEEEAGDPKELFLECVFVFEVLYDSNNRWKSSSAHKDVLLLLPDPDRFALI